jgi:enoyl-CoA hydratase/carnithine racemase
MSQLVRTHFPGGIRLALDSPQTANALSSPLVAELTAALETADGAAVVALASTGNAFCAGFDLAEPLPDDGAAARRFAAIQRLLELVRAAPFVTVALVDGPAYGAGADLVAACDYRVAGPRARFRFPGARFGLVLGLQRLVEVVGADAARDLVLRGRVVDCHEAHALGLVTDLSERAGWPGLLADLARDAGELDAPTRTAVLAVTRGADDADDATLLARSTARPGLAERIAAFRKRA